MYEKTYGQRFDPNFIRINNRPEDELPRDTNEEAEEYAEQEAEREDE